MPRPVARATLSCSFCSAYEDEVQVLIAGPAVFICDVCVGQCVEIIAERKEGLVRQLATDSLPNRGAV
jgi:ATP-dependent Clp protease ATP-binding subunit ClpX